MSADNGIIIRRWKDKYKVLYYSGEGIANAWKCKTLEEAVLKAQEVDEEYQTEYGIKLDVQSKNELVSATHKLKK